MIFRFISSNYRLVSNDWISLGLVFYYFQLWEGWLFCFFKRF